MVQRDSEAYCHCLANVVLNNVVVATTIRNCAYLSWEGRLRSFVVSARSRRRDGVRQTICTTGRASTYLLYIVKFIAFPQYVRVPSQELSESDVAAVFVVDLSHN